MTEAKLTLDNERFEAALAWHVRLEGDAGEDAWLGFAQWLEADPQNRIVFNQVDAVTHEITARLSSASVDDFTPVVVRPPVWRTAAFSKRVWVPSALAAALLVLGFFQFYGAPETRIYTTKVGEHRDVALEDGSTIHLNTDTQVAVSMARNSRNVRLEKGEAEFEVAPDAGRVFSVDLGTRRVEVVGTAFNIVRTDGRLSVAVEHGIVQVRQNAGTETPVKLMPGDQYLSSEGSAEYRVAKVNPSAIAPWRTGRLVFEDAPLAQVASELNHYFTKTIVIGDEATGALRFSGILKIDDEASILHRLEAFAPVTVQEKGDTLVLTRGSSK